MHYWECRLQGEYRKGAEYWASLLRCERNRMPCGLWHNMGTVFAETSTRVEKAVSLSDWLGWWGVVHPLWLGLVLVPELLLHDRLDNDSCDRAWQSPLIPVGDGIEEVLLGTCGLWVHTCLWGFSTNVAYGSLSGCLYFFTRLAEKGFIECIPLNGRLVQNYCHL